MKILPLVLAALLLPASAALAQTVLPSGAVAPATGTITPGTVPGTQTVVAPDMRNAGSPRAKARDEIAPGMSHRDERRLLRMAKPKSNPDGTMKPLPN